VIGGIAASVAEYASLIIHARSAAGIAGAFAAGSAVIAAGRFVLIVAAVGGAVYVIDRATGGLISSSVGRATGIC